MDDKIPSCSDTVCHAKPTVYGSITSAMNQFSFQFEVTRDGSNSNSKEYYTIDSRAHDYKFGYKHVGICSPQNTVEIIFFSGDQLTDQNAISKRVFSIDLKGDVKESDTCLNDNLCDKSKNSEVIHKRR